MLGLMVNAQILSLQTVEIITASQLSEIDLVLFVCFVIFFHRITELQLKLESALTELEQLRGSRQHQMQLVDSIVRQRDMYRILLSQTTGVVIPLQGGFFMC